MITWDEHKRLRNLADHGIDLEDLDGFFDGELLTMEDLREPYGEVRFRKRRCLSRVTAVRRLGASWRG
jgi:uncharacterized DUF497 family protein